MVRIGGLIPLISYTRRNFASPVQFWVGRPPPVLSQSLKQLFCPGSSVVQLQVNCCSKNNSFEIDI